MNAIAQPSTINFEPPVNLEAESNLIACVLRLPKAFGNLPEIAANDFADENHRLLWQEIVSILVSGQNLTTSELLRRLAPAHGEASVSLRMALLRLGSAVVLPEYAADYVAAIRDAAERRRLLDVCRDVARRATDVRGYATAAEVASIGVAEFSAVAEERTDMVGAAEIADRVIQRLATGEIPYFSTGLPKLDRAMDGGLYSGKVYAIQARKKTGKTGLLTTISYNLAAQRIPHLFLSLEGSPEHVMEMMLARRIGRNAAVFRSPPNDPRFVTAVQRAREDFADSGLYFRHKPRMTLDDLKATIARAAMSGRVKGIILDYFQLVTGQTRANQVEHLDNVAQVIAEAASHHGLWMLVAAQLNRENQLRFGDSLLMACDQAYMLGRVECGEGPDPTDPAPDEAWLEMTDTRYTRYLHIGEETRPGLIVRKDVGPFFEEKP